MKCPVCGRFMKAGGYYTNDHLDSFEETWRCTTKHVQTPVPEARTSDA